MEKIISFIVANWKLIAELCAAVFCLVMFLIRKKPVKVIDSIQEEIIGLLLGAIPGVEKPGHGAEKRADVLSIVQDWLVEKHPEVDISVYLDFASEMIEYILSTPQKKGETR